MAAVFTVAGDQLGALDAFLAERIAHQIDGAGLAPSLYLDGAVALQGANLGLAQALERLAPFGSGNAEPRFAVPGVRIAHADVVGKDHVRCTFTDPAGGRLAGIAFRSLDSGLGPFLLGRGGLPVHVAGRVRINDWQGRRSVQIVIDDAAPVA
jgi:single-stranded-DNA-specific exonuclease